MLDAMVRPHPRPCVRRPVGAGRAALGAAVAALLLAACGGSPGTIGPTGVDELTIPTPAPDPADFQDVVDNPWFPLPGGATWSYRVEHDVAAAGQVVEVEARVTPRHPVVDGVTTTEYLELGRSARGRLVSRSRSWYAQDHAGNVWLFGRRVDYPGAGRDPVVWRSGDPGVGAGLAMPASPRVGDGFWAVKVPGAEQTRLQVNGVDGSLETVLGPVANVVELQVRGGDTTLSYAPEVGLVLVDSGATRMTLASAELPGSL